MSSDNIPTTRKIMDWALCCLCQGEDKSSKDLRRPYSKECYHTAYQSLEEDLKIFAENDVTLPLGVNLNRLNDGSGIANTLLGNKAIHHNGCRALFRQNMVQRELQKRQRNEHESEGATFTPKKTRLSFNASLDREKPQCVCCEKYEEDSGEALHRARSANCGKNILKCALESQNWVVYARLNTSVNAEDAEAADIHYHQSCYVKLRNAARVMAIKSNNVGKREELTYDPLVVAQLVAFVQFNHSPPQTVCFEKTV